MKVGAVPTGSLIKFLPANDTEENTALSCSVILYVCLLQCLGDIE